jgi:hypothetical protein
MNEWAGYEKKWMKDMIHFTCGAACGSTQLMRREASGGGGREVVNCNSGVSTRILLENNNSIAPTLKNHKITLKNDDNTVLIW